MKLGTDCAVVRDPLLQYVSSAANVELCISDESSQYLHSSWLSLLTKVVHKAAGLLLLVVFKGLGLIFMFFIYFIGLLLLPD